MMTLVELVGPRGQHMNLFVEVMNPGPDVGITTTDGRVFYYDKLMSDKMPTYREYVELN